MRLKQLFVIVGLLGAAGLASAQTAAGTTSLTGTQIGNTVYFGASPVTVGTTGSFMDIFNLTWSGTPPTSLTSALTNLGNLSDIKMTVFDGFDATGTQLVQVSGGTSSFAGLNLPDNTISIKIEGTSSAPSSAYALAASVSPVPEPGTYAMFLAGIAAVGFVVRRRAAGAAA